MTVENAALAIQVAIKLHNYIMDNGRFQEHALPPCHPRIYVIGEPVVHMQDRLHIDDNVQSFNRSRDGSILEGLLINYEYLGFVCHDDIILM